MKKICLIQIWFGKLPDFFKYHLQTCNNQQNVDFLFFTDQIDDPVLKNAASNIKIKYLTPEIYKNFLFVQLGFQIKLIDFYKLHDHKLFYADVFNTYLLNYDYVGFYDVDILWGDIYNLLSPYLDQEFISIGDDVYYPGIRGPFCIWKNNLVYNTFYKQIDQYQNLLQTSSYQKLDEISLIKILKQNNIPVCDLGYLINFNCSGQYSDYSFVKNNKLYINNEEKLLLHFYYKNDLKFNDRENILSTYCSKLLKDDFYWVTYFDKNYEQFAREMLNSVRLFSNRKIIIYSIDYKVDVIKDLGLDEDQFVSIQFDFNAQDNIDLIKNIKSYILKDSCERFPDKKFTYIDSDLFLTVNCDSVIKYFNDLENYPLLNSNLYDYILVNNYKDSGITISPIEILGKKIGVENYLFPRRKANVIVYDAKCSWFFNEAIELYEKYNNSEFGIFALHDEDADNIILAKHNYTKCLPIIDIEETDDINNLNVFNNYFYGKDAQLSAFINLPNNINDILCFHKMKTVKQFEDIKNKYLNEIIYQNEIIPYYQKNLNTFFVQKKSFLRDRTFLNLVRIEIIDLIKNEIIFNLNNQNFHDYFTFYLSEIELTHLDYSVRIIEQETGKIIYTNLIKILE